MRQVVIHRDPEIQGGVPVFVGTRVPLKNLFDCLEAGESLDQFLADCPLVSRQQALAAPAARRWSRNEEERALDLCAGGDFRPSRWLRAGDPRTLAGIAAMLASQEGFDRTRMLALAERLHPGMSKPGGFNRWLARSPVHAARFLPMLQARMRESTASPPGARVSP